MMNIERVKSDLIMDDLYFPECWVKRSPNIVSENLDVDIDKHIECIGGSKYEVTVNVSITKPSKDLNVYVVAKATFSYDNSDSKLVEQVIGANTVAIMFPFIRSQISLMTTQPDMPPVVLPPINTMKLK